MIKNLIYKLNNRNRLLIASAFALIAIGLWSNFRPLWLESNLFTLNEITSIISVGMLCSCIMSIVISFLSTKVRIKEVLVLALSISTISMIGLLYVSCIDNIVLLKTLILLTIICETIFLVGIYPLMANFSKTKDTYSKKVIVQGFSYNFGILLGGFFVGRSFFGRILDYNFCLIVAIICSLISILFLITINYNKSKKNVIETKSFYGCVFEILKNKFFLLFFLSLFVAYASYYMVLGLKLMVLTELLHFSDSFASIFMIVLGIIASIVAYIVYKKIEFSSLFTGNLFKYGIRLLSYLLVVLTGRMEMVVLAIVITILSGEICAYYVDGAIINLVPKNSQFIFSNMLYFIDALASSFGIFMFGLCYDKGYASIFVFPFLFLLLYLLLNYIVSKKFVKIKGAEL